MNTRAIEQRVFNAMAPQVSYAVAELARLTRLGDGVTADALVSLWQAGRVRTTATPGSYVRPV